MWNIEAKFTVTQINLYYKCIHTIHRVWFRVYHLSKEMIKNGCDFWMIKVFEKKLKFQYKTILRYRCQSQPPFLQPISFKWKSFLLTMPHTPYNIHLWRTPHSQLNWAYGFNIYLLFFFDFTKCHHLCHGSYSLPLSLVHGKNHIYTCAGCVCVCMWWIEYTLFVFVYVYIYKHRTLQYFYSSSALEANKPITNTALNTNNCMMCAGNHTYTIDDDLCVHEEIVLPSAHPRKNWKMRNNQCVSDFLQKSLTKQQQQHQ